MFGLVKKHLEGMTETVMSSRCYKNVNSEGNYGSKPNCLALETAWVRFFTSSLV